MCQLPGSDESRFVFALLTPKETSSRLNVPGT